MKMPEWKFKAPKSDDEYFERMSKAIFQAGLNWQMIEKKWKNFRKAFSDFSIESMAKLGERDVKALMRNEGIVRNERKIRASIHNAKQSLQVKKKFGSFPRYIDSFKGHEDKLIADLQTRFHHLGPSTARIFLWMSNVELKPTKEELQWHGKSRKKK